MTVVVSNAGLVWRRSRTVLSSLILLLIPVLIWVVLVSVSVLQDLSDPVTMVSTQLTKGVVLTAGLWEVRRVWQQLLRRVWTRALTGT